MEFDPKTNKYTLSSGRRFYAYGGVLGLGGHYDPLELHDGWDGEVHGVSYEDAIAVPGNESMLDAGFGSSERQEIADHMIALWTAWGRLT